MGRRTTLPKPLLGRAFTVTEAKAYGITARLMWLHRPFHGIRSESSCDTVLERARALQQALPPESAFCDTTAIDLLELPLPSAYENGRLLQVMTPSDRPLIRHRDTRGHRGLETRRVITAHGLRVLEPVEAWLDLSPAWSLEDLVVLGDAILARDPDLIQELRAGVRARAGRRGIRRAREAIELIRPGVRSPMESLTRFLLVRSGLPEPEVNAVVTDALGTWLAEVDLVWRAEKVIVEYDGRWHGGAGQRVLDAARRRQLRAEGWIVIELFASDILTQPERTVWLVREALAGRIAA